MDLPSRNGAPAVSADGRQLRRNTLAVLSIGALMALGGTVSGGALPVQAAEHEQAQADVKRHFEIPPGALATALNRFADENNLQLVYSSEVTSSMRTAGVSGTYTPREALRLLLAGTGITSSVSTDGTVVLVKTEGDGIKLDPITVEGVGENPHGPVNGFVAGRNTTGAKTDTAIREVPQSVSVITRDSMEARGIGTVGDALAYTSGVATHTRGDSSGLGGDNISIRGFGGNGTAGSSSNEYWDGLRINGTNYAKSSIEPYAFERIEVLKGPTSVLYGNSQPGGIVNQVSKRPSLDAHNEIQAQAGTFNSYELDFDIGGKTTEDGSILHRFVGVISDEEAQTDFTGKRRKVLAPSFTFQPGPDTTFTLLTMYQNDEFDGGFVKYVPAVGSVFANPNGKIDRSRFTGDPSFDKWDRQAISVGYALEHSFNNAWTVRQNMRYLRNDLDLKAVYLNALQADNRTITRSTFAAEEHSDAVTVDNQAQVKFAMGPSAHTAIFGLDLQRNVSDTKRRSGTGPTLDLYNPVYYQTVTEPAYYQSIDTLTQEAGLYVQDQVKLDDWILTFGGRQDWTTSRTTNNLTGADTKNNADALTGRVGLGYNFASGVTPYASYSESFEPTTGTDFAGNTFKPTTGTQYEAGIKYEPTGYNASLTFSVFELTQQNVSTSDPEHTGFNIQTGEVRSRGVELEGLASLGSGWDVTASYTFLDQKVTESNGTDLGKRVAGVPQHKAALWGNYTFPHPSGVAGLSIGGGVRFVGDTAGDSVNSFTVPAVTLFDAMLSYDLEKLNSGLQGWQMRINAQNLADKEYVSSCLTNARCFYGIGRTVMGNLKFSW